MNIVAAVLMLLGYVIGIQHLITVGLVLAWINGFTLVVACNIPTKMIKNKIMPLKNRVFNILWAVVPLVVIGEYILAAVITVLYAHMYERWSKC
jgi:predicted small integral membrane protein